jgi:hypothetical protein
VLSLTTIAADDESLRWCRAVSLRAGASVALAIDARDGSGLAERAAAIRAADPRVVLVIARDSGDAPHLAAALEAARVAFVDADHAPRVIAAAHPEILSDVREAAGGMAFDRAGAPTEDQGTALVQRLRALRGAAADGLSRVERAVTRTGMDAVLACEVDDDGARLAFSPRGPVVAAELGVGVGRSADALVRRAGPRAVRRWLVGDGVPEVPLLRDRVANLSRFVTAAPRPLELALAREALRELVGAVRRDLGVGTIDRPRQVLLGGAFARFAPAEAVAAFLDAVEPRGLARVHAGEVEAALVVVPQNQDRGRPLRIVDERGERPVHPVAGALSLIPTTGRTVVHAERDDVVAGSPAIGVVIDARGRPLAVPDRDGERQALLRKWAASWR